MKHARSVFVAAALTALAATACGEGGDRADPSTVHQRPAMGYSLTIPEGWHRAEHNLTAAITDPVEMVTLATAPFRAREGICSALERVVPSGALVTVQERLGPHASSSQFPPRPCRRHGSEPPLPIDDRWFSFSDHGRAFEVLVAFGRKAPEATRADAFALVASLELARADRDPSFSIAVPDGWRRADGPVDELTTNPRELVVLSTFHVPRASEATESCGPFYDHALEQMRGNDALVAIRERLGNDVAGPRDFPERPETFRLRPAKPEAGGCRPDQRRRFRRWWIPFEDRGRDLYAQVEIGVDAPDAVRSEAEEALNSFRPD